MRDDFGGRHQLRQKWAAARGDLPGVHFRKFMVGCPGPNLAELKVTYRGRVKYHPATKMRPTPPVDDEDLPSLLVATPTAGPDGEPVPGAKVVLAARSSETINAVTEELRR